VPKLLPALPRHSIAQARMITHDRALPDYGIPQGAWSCMCSYLPEILCSLNTAGTEAL
jgi:hypothetical protein